ncbi:MAG: hypothetical protein R6V56_06225 [Lentisphaeria bacterium]
MDDLLKQQIEYLEEPHFLVLYWGAAAEDRGVRYNITNCFDDLKFQGITRTKQTATAILDSLEKLRFIDIRDEGNRKNIYITKYGAKALETLVLQEAFSPRKSIFLEVQ